MILARNRWGWLDNGIEFNVDCLEKARIRAFDGHIPYAHTTDSPPCLCNLEPHSQGESMSIKACLEDFQQTSQLMLMGE
jgi:hypothetical protein